jgi:enolase
LAYLEDPVAPEDRDGWRAITAELGDKLILAGKGLFLTDAKRLTTAVEDEIANAVVIIPGQVGTLTETIACLKLASEKHYQTIISQRRGETNDDFIADLAVAAGANYFKGGAPTRGERVAKWNRLAALEQELYGSNK